MNGSTGTRITLNSVKVFGSAVVRVPPDTASIVIAVSRTEEKPDAAFSSAREGAQSVTTYLHKAGVEDFGSSRVSLWQQNRFTAAGENRPPSYQAKIEFNVILREIDKTDAVLSGLISAGANSLTSATFQTTRLKELRAEARRRAVASAREKAELYCEAAGVAVGSLLAIEDFNPDLLFGYPRGVGGGEGLAGHAPRATPEIDDLSVSGRIDPGAIAIAAAVNVLYRIKSQA
jgi:uncharacterized protein YggE